MLLYLYCIVLSDTLQLTVNSRYSEVWQAMLKVFLLVTTPSGNLNNGLMSALCWPYQLVIENLLGQSTHHCMYISSTLVCSSI